MLKSLKLLFSPVWWWTTILVFFAIMLTIRLGFWQLDRLQQQQAFNSHVNSVKAMPELLLSDNIAGVNLSVMEYRPVIVTGYFDFDNQVAIRNQVWVQTWGNEIGFTLLAPFLMQNGQVVLVQRGWVPMEYDSPLSWHVFDQRGEITIQGIIRLPLEKGELGGGFPDPTLSPGQAGLNFWNYVNIERIQQQLPYEVLPVYVQQAPRSGQEVLPYPSLLVLDLTDGAHLGYAIQWFIYALLLIIGYPYYIKTQARKST